MNEPNALKTPPKEMLQFYKIEIENSVKNKQHYLILTHLESLIEYSTGILLPSTERGRLERSLEYLHKMVRSDYYDKTYRSFSPNEKNSHYVKWVIDPQEELSGLLDFLIKKPAEIKLKTPIEKKQTPKFLSKISSLLKQKEYISTKNAPDSMYKDLIIEINKSYENSMNVSILILLRKLFENFIIDIFRKYEVDQKKFLTNRRGFQNFETLIDNMQDLVNEGQFPKIKIELNEALEFVDSLRIDGNKSAHSVIFSVDPQQIEVMKMQVQKTVDIFLKIFDLAKIKN